jgi:hypothetical protein
VASCQAMIQAKGGKITVTAAAEGMTLTV